MHTDLMGSLTQQRQQEDQGHSHISNLKRQSIRFDRPQHQTLSDDGASQEKTQRNHRHC